MYIFTLHMEGVMAGVGFTFDLKCLVLGGFISLLRYGQCGIQYQLDIGIILSYLHCTDTRK